MNIASYADLLAAIPVWAIRNDLDDVAPLCVQFFEAEVNRVLRTSEMIAHSTIQLVPDDGGIVPLPGDYLEVRNLTSIGGGGPRLLKPISQQLATSWNMRLKGGLSMYYSVTGKRIEVIPNGSPKLEMEYYAALPPLAGVNTNFLLKDHPDIYLYGSLVHAAQYMKNDSRIPVWRQHVDKFFSDMVTKDAGAVYGSSPLSMRTNRRL